MRENVNLDIYIYLINMPKGEGTCTVKIPGFIYRGFEFPDAEIATDIEKLTYFDSMHKLHTGGITLAESRALYELALAAQNGEDLPGIPKAAVEGALYIYENIQSRIGMGEWIDDACDYDNGKKPRGVLAPKDFISVRWIKHPIFKKTEKIWETLLHEDSEQAYIFLPPDGFVIPTVEGLYRPETGTPFATEKDRKKALKLLNKAGLDNKKDASYFWRSRRTEGVCCVIRQHIDYYGAFTVLVDADPDFRDEYVGWRLINRL